MAILYQAHSGPFADIVAYSPAQAFHMLRRGLIAAHLRLFGMFVCHSLKEQASTVTADVPDFAETCLEAHNLLKIGDYTTTDVPCCMLWGNHVNDDECCAQGYVVIKSAAGCFVSSCLIALGKKYTGTTPLNPTESSIGEIGSDASEAGNGGLYNTRRMYYMHKLLPSYVLLVLRQAEAGIPYTYVFAAMAGGLTNMVAVGGAHAA